MIHYGSSKGIIRKLNDINIEEFRGGNNRFPLFLKSLKVDSFRHIKDIFIDFIHPVTVISGVNAIGKTSLLLLIACSHEEFKKLDTSTPTPTLE